ncbi:hypothetical protein KFU94_14365 [Chloroflexi bacterium TSY]|nr:hypothetical protein [Chloroflexi bacterium TSY]
MLTTTDLRWAQATTPPTLAGQLGPASYSTRPLTPLSLLLLPFFSGQIHNVSYIHGSLEVNFRLTAEDH